MEVELVDKRYVSKALNLSVGTLNSYRTKYPDRIPAAHTKVGSAWMWIQEEVDAFAAKRDEQQKFRQPVQQTPPPATDDFGTEWLSNDYLFTLEQGAHWLGYTTGSLRWLATNSTAPRPIPSVLVKKNGKGRPKRYFKLKELIAWKREGARAVDKCWPPSPEQLRSSIAQLKPDPADFPDNGDAIPSYVNLAGRTIKPAWLTCLCGCGQRFLSPDRTNIRYIENCRYKVNAA